MEIKSYFKRYDHIIDEHELEEHLARNKHELPLISIISPAYNEGVLIVDTVSSFLNQSYKNKEVIILSDVFEREPNAVGIGTPIGVVNDCNVGPDGVDDASVPKSFWAKIQVIEYLRSFLLGRMFAQRYRGLQIVSGAFGVYKRWIIEAVNGYSSGSLAEDMDIDGKIWRFIDRNKMDFRIMYIPEAFCWSEVPDTFRSLTTQRDRWARGMTQTIWKNRDLFFNPRYKLLGMFSYPYYVFFEWLTPFIEIGGLIYFLIGGILGWFSFMVLSHIFLIYWMVGIILNLVAISVEAFTRGHYKNRATLLKLSFYAVFEPLFYHWINSYLYVLGNIKLVLFKKRGWGTMERVGLTKGEVKEIMISD